MAQPGKFLPGHYYQYVKVLSETEWTDTKTIAQRTGRSRGQVARVLKAMRADFLVDCRVDIAFERARHLWRLRPKG